MRGVVPTLALLAFVVALAGCGNSDDPEAVPPASTATTETEGSSTETERGTETTATQPAPAPEPKPKPKVATVALRVVDGRPQGGIARPSVKRNARVVLVVRSDTADEVHLHGYDVLRPVAPGKQARLAFVAKIPGRFEIELEESGVQLAELTVR
jgi:predicted small lipoprotein YifL